MLRHIPNAVTCLNLICGLLAIVQIFNHQYINASYLVMLGAFFDFIDGFLARLLHAQSTIGKDLDSLSDLVTFGAVPGFLIYHWLGLHSQNMYLANLALTIPVFSAIRLAIFNNDARQSIDFIGLPTPANALFFMSLPLVLKYDKLALATYIQNPIFLSIAIVVSCTLMVSEIRLFSLKIKNFSLNKHIYHIILIIVANILFLTISYTAIPIIVILYIILSVIKNFLQPKYHP